MAEDRIIGNGKYTFVLYPEIFIQWQRRMRLYFPHHWDQIKGARDPSDVILYMNKWLSTDVSLSEQPQQSCEVWMKKMDDLQSSIIIH